MPGSPVLNLALAVALFAGALGRAGAQGAAMPADPDRQQLDRIEAKLDTILQRLGDGSATPNVSSSGASDRADTPSPSAPVTAPPATAATGSQDASVPAPADRRVDTGSYRPGAIAVAHAAPSGNQPLGEIPDDSIGGFVYTGGPIQMSNLSDRGVRYVGPAGIEMQGWLKATQTGRYQIAADLQLRFGRGAIAARPCTFSAWLEDQAIGSETRTSEPWTAKGKPIVLSFVLGAELQPGLYKLRLWIACANLESVREGESQQLEMLLKAPGEMNLRPVSANELLHKPE